MSAIDIGPSDIRGFTLWRPWPWAFTHAGKRVENRCWQPPRGMIGKWLALHSGKRFDEDALHGMQYGEFGDAARKVPPTSSEHPEGVITCVTRLTGFYELPDVTRVPDSFAFGPIVWQTPYVITLPRPVECKGKQGLWILPELVWRDIRAQVIAATTPAEAHP